MPRPQDGKTGLKVSDDKPFPRASNPALGYTGTGKQKRAYQMWQAGNTGKALTFAEWKKKHGK